MNVRHSRLACLAAFVLGSEYLAFSNVSLCHYPRDPLPNGRWILYIGHSSLANVCRRGLAVLTQPLAFLHAKVPPIAPHDGPIPHADVWRVWNTVFCEQSAAITAILLAIINTTLWLSIIAVAVGVTRLRRRSVAGGNP
jgi:hypothetical protein